LRCGLTKAFSACQRVGRSVYFVFTHHGLGAKNFSIRFDPGF
jgi:hypothetical protein